MAPELLNGQPCFESDIFSLGLILLELATGIEIPVDGIEWRSLRQGILPLE